MTAAGSQLRDAYGRVATDLRVSVTDHCDLRCVYCMPEQGLDWLDLDEQLTLAELERLVAIFVSLGVRTVRLTGGEPLMRPHLVDLVDGLSQLGLDDLSMTTNATMLARHAAPLAAAGLRRVNVSLDTLVRHRFEQMTRRDALGRVLAGIDAARDAGLTPIKINVVLVDGTNDDEILDFVEFARATGSDVRFIEDMPLGGGGAWHPEIVVHSSRILDTITERHELVALERGSAPAAGYRFADGAPGRIGLISSVTEPFCEQCDRLRLTADGQLRTCLFAHVETDLRTPLRDGADDGQIALLIRAAVTDKGPGHMIGRPGFEQPVRLMSRIGG